jgi:hypothetical protein
MAYINAIPLDIYNQPSTRSGRGRPTTKIGAGGVFFWDGTRNAGGGLESYSCTCNDVMRNTALRLWLENGRQRNHGTGSQSTKEKKSSFNEKRNERIRILSLFAFVKGYASERIRRSTSSLLTPFLLRQ